MRPPFPGRTAISVIRFTRRIALQCHPHGPCFPDWVVCDTIANGSRQTLGRTGKRGGKVVRFEKTFAPAALGGTADQPGVTVRVLGEMTPDGCFALQVLAPGKTRRKMSDRPGFFNRSSSK
jgi:hypothetical protein